MRERRPLAPLAPEPVISVISLFHNQERLAAAAIESVLAQDWPRDRLDWVAVDDGSTDGTADVIASYAKDIPWMRFTAQENQGVRGTLNRVMGELRGDLVTSVAGDDVMLPGRLRRLADHLVARPSVGLVYSDLAVIGEDGEIISPSFMRGNGLWPYVGRPVGKLLHHNFVSGGGIMFRADLLDVVHPIPEHAAWEDYWWAWRIASVADLDYVDEPLYGYRQHAGNVSHGASGDRLLRAQRDELRFRRHLLGAVACGEAGALDLVTACQRHELLVSAMQAASGETREQLLPVDPADTQPAQREVDLARAGLIAGDADTAAWHLARALRGDPHHPELPGMIRTLTDAFARPPMMPDAVPDHRGVLLVADADELVDAPELLGTFSRAVGEDDATLVIHAADWTLARTDAILTSIVDRCAMVHGDRDVLAQPAPAVWRQTIEQHADALLTARAGEPGGLPRFGPDDEQALRRFLTAPRSVAGTV